MKLILIIFGVYSVVVMLAFLIHFRNEERTWPAWLGCTLVLPVLLPALGAILAWDNWKERLEVRRARKAIAEGRMP